MVHTMVRQEMKLVWTETAPIVFLDAAAQALLAEGRERYQAYRLGERMSYRRDTDLVLITWSGDACNNALVLLLERFGLRATNDGLTVTVKCEDDQFATAVTGILGLDRLDPQELLEAADNLQREKWDWALPRELLTKSYASLHLDFEEARRWLQAFDNQLNDKW